MSWTTICVIARKFLVKVVAVAFKKNRSAHIVYPLGKSLTPIRVVFVFVRPPAAAAKSFSFSSPVGAIGVLAFLPFRLTIAFGSCCFLLCVIGSHPL